ncbi:uncharacterized protein LOC123554446 [Mercenaria mercenaria]|uniref:uncharacterized protein LOC123554446 n=1 Tax=Mercenaria mercenaria TaxID=6596 RepID=UPI00234F2EE8|nr:uncharacterized protein LOC123554446 [Mercenaria mercenaria]
MKRQDSHRQTKTDGKRRKLEMEVSKSTPETILEEDNDKKDTEFTNVTGTTLVVEDDIETDGEKEPGNDKTCQISRSRPKLEDGFGFDTIYPRQLQELPSVPNEVPQDYADMSPRKLTTEHRMKFCGIPLKRQKPDQHTKITIPHKFADKSEEDDFGATLCTYKYGKKYYRHFLVKIEPNQPASEMKIKDNDELVLVNDLFVPKLSHTEVLGLFQHVKVEGIIQLILAIRRKLSKQKWEWIQTSAVLPPGNEKDDLPAVTDLQYKEFEGDKPIERPISKHLYKIPGTAKYLDIRDGKVRTGLLNDGNDRKMIIWKRTKFWPVDSEGHINFASTLCDVTKQWFIAIDPNGQIVVQLIAVKVYHSSDISSLLVLIRLDKSINGTSDVLVAIYELSVHALGMKVDSDSVHPKSKKRNLKDVVISVTLFGGCVFQKLIG